MDSEQEETPKVIVEEKKEQVLWIDARALSKEDFDELIDMMMGYPGTITAKILNGGKRFEFSVNLNRAFMAELRAFLPAECIKVL